jgi:hypothetical protein
LLLPVALIGHRFSVSAPLLVALFVRHRQCEALQEMHMNMQKMRRVP